MDCLNRNCCPPNTRRVNVHVTALNNDPFVGIHKGWTKCDMLCACLTEGQARNELCCDSMRSRIDFFDESGFATIDDV